eukprot:Gregarina_sp_Pseudo_9__819@NODE_1524_length_1523_cov_709_126685_g1412_i0_p1_GENE_NODE_1524_length_1523_cov_709_126685_g1412_i0NODE_1524_length_1523_cov_709_126685_g1412_i0_p1_ORF_typecomplete_len363_score11_40_NODE_1524_length_1523_cov_709_126685_g1412_i01241212
MLVQVCVWSVGRRATRKLVVNNQRPRSNRKFPFNQSALQQRGRRTPSGEWAARDTHRRAHQHRGTPTQRHTNTGAHRRRRIHLDAEGAGVESCLAVVVGDLERSALPSFLDGSLQVCWRQVRLEVGRLGVLGEFLNLAERGRLLGCQHVDLLGQVLGLCQHLAVNQLGRHGHFHEPRSVDRQHDLLVLGFQLGQQELESGGGLHWHRDHTVDVFRHLHRHILRHGFVHKLRDLHFTHNGLFVVLRDLHDFLYWHFAVFDVRDLDDLLALDHAGNLHNLLFVLDDGNRANLFLVDDFRNLHDFLDILDLRHLHDLLLDDRLGDFNDFLSDLLHLLHDLLVQNFLGHNDHLFDYFFAHDLFWEF